MSENVLHHSSVVDFAYSARGGQAGPNFDKFFCGLPQGRSRGLQQRGCLACEMRASQGCYNYGLVMKAEGVANDALMAFALACSFGDADGCRESKGRRSSDIPEVIARVKERAKKKTAK